MDRYTKIRGGSSLWVDNSIASSIINEDFFGSVVPGASSVFFVKVAGVWKQAIVWIKVGGIWKQATPKVNVNNLWI
jgi:hypothetical protein